MQLDPLEQQRASSIRPPSPSQAGVVSVKAAQKYVSMCLRTLQVRIKLACSKEGKQSLWLSQFSYVERFSLVPIEYWLKYCSEVLLCYNSVSYTHLDVYKRQEYISNSRLNYGVLY